MIKRHESDYPNSIKVKQGDKVNDAQNIEGEME